MEQGDSLMLLPVTGNSGGKRKRTVVTMTYAMPSFQMVSHIPFTLDQSEETGPYQIRKPCKCLRKHEWSLAQHLAAPKTIDGYGHRVRHTKGNNRG